jgi:hypothetical protein
MAQTFGRARPGAQAWPAQRPDPLAAAGEQHGEGERDGQRAARFGRPGPIRSPGETRIGIDPKQRRLRGFFFAFAHIKAFTARGAAPVDELGAVFRAMVAELPEGFARPGAPAAMRARRGGGEPTRL